MILEATNRPGSLKPIKYPCDVDRLARLILAILIGHQWLVRTWSRAQAKTQVYLLTRFDLLRRRFALCPVGAAFLAFVIFFLCLHLWLHWVYVATFLIEKGMVSPWLV